MSTYVIAGIKGILPHSLVCWNNRGSSKMRKAQFELRKKYPRPQDWGAFICQGYPRALLRMG